MNGQDCGSKIIVTMQDLMEQMDISDKTLYRMIESGDLPDFTYGSKTSKKKGWHSAVLQRHAIERYERSTSYKNVRHAGKVGSENVSIVPLGRGDRTVPQKDAHLDNRNTPKQKLRGKVVSKSVRPPARKSRISAGFTYPFR